MAESVLSLRILTPDKALPAVECDRVQLQLPDGADGQGGGSVGIHPGHERALLALAPGRVDAYFQGRLVLSATLGSGFASIDQNIVTILADSVPAP